MRVIGPNCLGVIVPSLRLNASFAAAMPPDGRVAFISQSGALCTSVLDWALAEGIGFSYFVSIGNMVDVSFGDLIDYFGADERTRSIILYVESITQAQRFMSAARAFSRTKPIVVYKSGRFAESARAASSHTGAMAGEDAVYDAAFRRVGAVRVYEIGEIFDTAELVARVQPPLGPRLAIVTNAGGPGVMATDALIAGQGQLAELAPETLEKLNKVLPPFWSHNNPVDILGDASPERYGQVLEVVLADPGVDAVLVILTPQAMTDPTGTARAVIKVAKAQRKPVLAAWMGGTAVQEGVNILNQNGIPTYLTPDQAVQAFMHLVDYGRNLALLYQTPREIPVEFAVDRGKIREDFLPHFRRTKILGEMESKALLAAYGIPVTMPKLARTEDEAVTLARELGFPVVLKIHSPEITHKTDVGGVVVGVLTEEGVRESFSRILANVREKAPQARIEGVTVQRMAPTAKGVEMILGAKKDPTFGAVLMVGAGGITAEVLRDRALGLPPLNERLATHLLESLRIWPLLQGFRGRPRINVEKLLEVIMRFSYLVADFPEIQEIDVNPLVVTPTEVVAVDARVVVDQEALQNPPRPYSHLVIRPYPEGYERWVTLKDGTKVLLRPIRPEDEPLWHEMLAISSRESIRFRFRYIFKENGRKRMVGVGRLVADP
ncbi:MAG: acetate--CoA ligase family protein, partial [Candidatus Bipolaricaulaceae bacterium]